MLIDVDHLPVGVVVLDRLMKITSMNSTLIGMGIVSEKLTRSGKDSSVSDTQLFENIDLSYELEHIQKGIPFEKEIKRLSIGKRNLSIICKGIPLFSKNEFNGAVLLVEDLRLIPEISMTPNLPTDLAGDALAALSDLVFVCEGSGKIVFYGGTKLSDFFTADEKVLGRNINSLFNFSDITEADTSSLLAFEHRDKTSYLDIKASSFKGADGAEMSLFICYDRTEAYKELQQLKDQLAELQEYALLFERGGLALFSLCKNNTINSWGKEAEKFFGRKMIEVFGTSISTLIRQFRRSSKGGVFTSTYTSPKGTSLGEFRLIPTGERLWVICRDITEEQAEQKELQLLNKQYSAFLNTADDMICRFNENLEITGVNDKFTQVFGKKKGKQPTGIQEIFSGYLPNLEQIRTESTIKERVTAVSNAGKEFPAEATFVYFEEGEGIWNSYSCLLRDLTSEEKTAQDILLMQSIFEASNDGIALKEEDELIFVNNSFTKMFGYNSELEIIGRNFNEFTARNEEAALEENEALGVKKDGSTFILEFSRASFEFSGKTFVVLITRDITAIKNAQRQIEESEAKYRSIAENIDDFLWIMERKESEFTPLFVTASFAEMTGYTIAEFQNNIRFWFRIIHPEDLADYFSELKDLLRNKYKLTGSLECRIITKSGASIWVRNKVSIIRDGDKIVKMFGLVSNITKEKQAEQEINQSTEDLKKLNEAKDRFISIISHDMRTPFSSILGFTDLLLSDDFTVDEMKKYITYIQDSTKIMLSLVNSLLDWTRLQTGRMKFEPVKQGLHTIISKSFSAVSGTAMQKNIELINDTPKDIVVFVDQNLILQVFNNLFSNAIKFTPSGGKITAGITGETEGRFLEVFVKDTGVGIKESDIPNLFRIDSKFTTPGTEGEKGTGLGLNVVQEIIQKHGGTIRLESKVGAGTKFLFTLPVASSKIALVETNHTDRV
ncbi:MAG: hypothetical protein B6D45_02245, partial [Ignavibacteriales bacterium UTCHB3]